MENCKVIIMRGLPGAGKSTWIRNYKLNAPAEEKIAVRSADKFFTDDDGNYNFIPTKIGEAHKQCMSLFLGDIILAKAFKTKNLTIIVDNTNVHAWEYTPYLSVAEASGMSVEIVEIVHDAQRLTLAEDLAKRNAHGVPIHTIERMIKGWERALPWHNVLRVPMWRP